MPPHLILLLLWLLPLPPTSPARTKKKSHGNAREKEKKGRRPGTLGQEKGREEGSSDSLLHFLEERFRHFLRDISTSCTFSQVLLGNVQQHAGGVADANIIIPIGRERKGGEGAALLPCVLLEGERNGVLTK